MLRRIFTATKPHPQQGSLNLALSATAATTTLLCQGRYLIHFSEQNKVLANNQEHKGYSSNVWISADDLGKSVKTSAKLNEVPTEVMIRKTLELWNASQLLPALAEAEPAVHTSVKTSKPYGRAMQTAMEERAQQYNFTSKHWMTRWEAKQRGLEAVQMARTCYLPLSHIDKLYNVEQLLDPHEVVTMPITGQTKTPFGAAMKDRFIQKQREKGYPTGLWYSSVMMRNMELEARPGEEGVEVTGGFDDSMWYNVEQLVDHANVLKELNRAPSADHTSLCSGDEISSDVLLARLDRTPFENKYWVQKKEIDSRGWQLLPAAAGISSSKFSTAYYNVAQLTDPVKGFTDAGLYYR